MKHFPDTVDIYDAAVPEAVQHSLRTAVEMWPETEELDYFVRLMNKAVELAGKDMEDLEAIHRLGKGWVAEETLAIAVYCALKYENDFDKALIASVNHSGDSDSTGAVTGNILGAKWGLNGIPEKYCVDLELREVILEIADDLWHDCRMNEYEEETWDQVWLWKYLEMTWRK